MLKTGYQKWRRFREMNKIVEDMRRREGCEEKTEREEDGGAEIDRGC